MGESDYWIETNHRTRQCWLGLQSLLRTRYALHLLALDYTDPLVDVQEILDEVRKRQARQTAYYDTNPKYVTLVEPSELESKPEVVDKPELELEVGNIFMRLM